MDRRRVTTSNNILRSPMNDMSGYCKQKKKDTIKDVQVVERFELSRTKANQQLDADCIYDDN
jgi:hypothetical protein